MPDQMMTTATRWERVKVSEAAPWCERRIGAGAWGGKGGLHCKRRQVPRRRGKTSIESLSKRSSRKHERVSVGKSSSGESRESWFHS